MEFKSKSKFIDYNGRKKNFTSEDGKPIDGLRFVKFDDSDLDYIVRLKNGLLHAINQPAVEGPGHLEFWHEGQLHREGNLAAVSSEGFSHNEKWEHGIFLGILN